LGVFVTEDHMGMVEQLAKDAREGCREYIDWLERRYTVRRRSSRKLPVVAFLGWGHCGKDTAADYWAKIYEMTVDAATSRVVSPLVAWALGASNESVYEARHEDRQFWYQFCHHLREQDPVTLVRWVLGSSDVVVGVRADYELAESVKAGLIDLTVWVDRPGTAADPTVDFTAEDCDIVINNDKGLEEYYGKLTRLGDTLRLPKRNL